MNIFSKYICCWYKKQKKDEFIPNTYYAFDEPMQAEKMSRVPYQSGNVPNRQVNKYKKQKIINYNKKLDDIWDRKSSFYDGIADY